MIDMSAKVDWEEARHVQTLADFIDWHYMLATACLLTPDREYEPQPVLAFLQDAPEYSL